jgi:hypothetical protein
VVDPAPLRIVLSSRLESAFSLGKMGDAAEALDGLLAAVHEDTAGRDRSALCRPDCPAHASFRCDTLERIRCARCGTVSEESFSSSFAVVVEVTSLIRVHREQPQSANFGALLRLASTMSSRSCRRKACGSGTCVTERQLETGTLPGGCLTVSLNWPTGSDDLAITNEVLGMLLTHRSLDVATLFDGNPDHQLLDLVGIVCWYAAGGHYSAVALDDRARAWMSADDTVVHHVGRWDHVIDRCTRGRQRPTILFYQQQQQH